MKTNNTIKAFMFTIAATAIISQYSVSFGVELSGNIIAVYIYKLLWVFFGAGIGRILVDER
jgi:hypothetical protein